MAKVHDLTEKQKLFCEHYVVDLNGSQAALRAGYEANSCRQQAYALLSLPQIKKEINRLRKAIRRNTGIDKDWVINRAKDISDRCMQIEPVMIFDGEAWVESGEYQFDSSGANKATEMIGKIIGVFEKDNMQKPGVPIIPATLSVTIVPPIED